MTEEQTPGDRWMKRIQWSRSGYPKEDERVNTLASLWVEGVLTPFELAGEVYSALKENIGRVGTGFQQDTASIPDHSKAIVLSAQWLALVGAADFCTRHLGWETPEKKQEALHRMNQSLGVSSALGRAPGIGSWVNQVRQDSSMTDLDRRFEVAAETWSAGEMGYDEYFQELIDVQKAAERRKTEALNDPQSDQWQTWVDAVRVNIKGMALRVVADYCNSHGWVDAEPRRRALDQVEKALDRPIGRGDDVGR